MIIPKVKGDKAILIRAQYGTGKILNNDNTFYNSEGNNYYKIMASIEEAITFAEKEVKKNLVEVLIYDGEGNFYKIFKPKKNNQDEEINIKKNIFQKLIKGLKNN